MKKFPLKYIALTQLFTASHKGIDLGWNSKQGGKNVPVYAADDGVVYSTKDNDKSGKSWGNFVKIKHNDGTYTLYAHLRDGIKVKKGQKVKQGDQVGNMGNTGKSGANHLHYEVYVGGASTSNRKNPLDYTYVYEDQIVHPDDTKKVKYKPKETTPSTPKADEKDKQINELNSKIKEQDIQILNLKAQISQKETQIEELKQELINNTQTYKRVCKCSKTGLYWLKMYEGETLYTDRK